MLAQFSSSSSDSVSTTLLVIGILNAVLIIVFFVMASDISKIRKAADLGLLGIGELARVCQFCEMPCPNAASVCHRCGRDIGAWLMHGGAWWVKGDNGAWVWRSQGEWHQPDDWHEPPA